MDSNVLIILIAVGVIALVILIRWALTRLTDQAGNAIGKAIANYKNARNDGTPVRLADMYPDFYAQVYGRAPQPAPAPVPEAPASAPPAFVPEDPAASAPPAFVPGDPAASAPPAFVRTSAAPAAAEPPAPFVPAQEEPFPADRCCLCGRGLENGYAVLFTGSHGRALIDRNCANGIAVMVRSQKPADVARAVRYFSALRDQAHPEVAAHMDEYLSAAEEWLNDHSPDGEES